MKHDEPELVDEYLWDGSGELDPEIVRLERLLAPLRPASPLRVLPPRTAPVARRFLRPGTAAAAAVLLIATASWYLLAGRRTGWEVRSLAGVPVVEGAVLDREGRLRVGEWLVTDAVSRARIGIGRIGEVDVDPHTRVQLVASGVREHRLALERGTIHARISAPPRFFFVNTPSATAIDLGCAYSLQVDDAGAGLIRVTQGWVAFERGGRESYIPAGAVCATRPGVGPGTPYYEDAPSGYGEALTILDFATPADPRRPAAFELVLSNARERDALTLWHLLVRGPANERARAYDRLAVLVPPPFGVTREAVLRGNRAALHRWWDVLSPDRRWWRLLKKKW